MQISAVLTALIMLSSSPASVMNVSEKICGYGQGKITDKLNRPSGAVDFSSTYKQYDSYAISEDDRTIILTFDQGYENGYTSAILDTLKEKNVHAMFFLTGDYAEKETKLVERMISEGHILGNHGMKHASFPSLSESELKNEIMSLHRFVEEKYNYSMQYIRPPCGEYSEKSLRICSDLGYKTVMWSFAYVDWEPQNQPDPVSALKNAEEHAHGGAIYLLHSVSRTNSLILGDLIDDLRSKGYKV